ncbi:MULTISPECIES: hypothetical protein [Dietzia]|uniref:hypothetical protein n=1 Tax=Dietzia TaxID=37914 RepID=UPI0013EA6414|nr:MULTISPECIES: hypothetical protein [Dietzia]MCT1710420.1 hypothetical protein [Dietzia cinnamea]MCT2275228.1 hypothetical protein [Dietzia cinnamea]
MIRPHIENVPVTVRTRRTTKAGRSMVSLVLAGCEYLLEAQEATSLADQLHDAAEKETP